MTDKIVKKTAPSKGPKKAEKKEKKVIDPALGFLNITVQNTKGETVHLRGITIRDNEYKDNALLAMLAAAKRNGEPLEIAMQGTIKVNDSVPVSAEDF